MCQHGEVTTFQRAEALLAMSTSSYDVVVFGAGMTGAGVALDAASRGLRVALIDRGDIASGTSSKSSKLVHGGLRYLQQREFRLVCENLRERQRLLNNAPHSVEPLPFLIPLFGSNGGGLKKASREGLLDRPTSLRPERRVAHRPSLSPITREETLKHLPTLQTNRLVAGFLYYDARGDDARVALTLAKTAALTYDAQVATYLRAQSVTKNAEGRVVAVHVRDELDGDEPDIDTVSVVNATGVWADDVYTMTEHEPSHRITPAKGCTSASLAIDCRLTSRLSLVSPTIVAASSWCPFQDGAYTYVGTTDTAYDGSLDEPLCTPKDVALPSWRPLTPRRHRCLR